MTTSDMMYSFVLALAAFGMTLPTVVGIVPKPTTEEIFRPTEVRIERTADGPVVWAASERTAPLHMSYRVTIFARENGQLVEFCATDWHGPFPYPPDVRPKRPVTLDWWTNGDCPDLPETAGAMFTTWKPQTLDMEAITFRSDFGEAEG